MRIAEYNGGFYMKPEGEPWQFHDKNILWQLNENEHEFAKQLESVSISYEEWKSKQESELGTGNKRPLDSEERAGDILYGENY